VIPSQCEDCQKFLLSEPVETCHKGIYKQAKQKKKFLLQRTSHQDVGFGHLGIGTESYLKCMRATATSGMYDMVPRVD